MDNSAVLPVKAAVWSDCAELSKARLSALVVATTFVGYFLAYRGSLDFWNLFWAVTGTALAAAGANSFNQWYEVALDANMKRTCSRPLPAGRVSPYFAFAWALSCSMAGVLSLAFWVNPLTAALALANILIYVLVYTPLKTRSSLCTLVGAICGAIPPIMGWTAATGQIDSGAWILGAVLFVWQIPHFLALAWLYRDDYERGGFKMLPIIDPNGQMTCLVILLYCFALIPVGASSTLAGITGFYSLIGSVLAGGYFLYLGFKLYGNRSRENARTVFFASLIYLPLVMGLMIADRGATNALAVSYETEETDGMEIANGDIVYNRVRANIGEQFPD